MILLPREKLIKNGPSIMDNSELLSIILNTGYKNESVFDLSKRVVREYDNNLILNIRKVSDLIEIFNIPEMKACQILSSLELGRRLFRDRDELIKSLDDSYKVYKKFKYLETSEKEYLIACFLNKDMKKIHEEIISINLNNKTNFNIREILKIALEINCYGFILIKNDLNINIKIENDYINKNIKLKKASKIIGINFLDSIVIGKNEYISLKEKYLIK